MSPSRWSAGQPRPHPPRWAAASSTSGCACITTPSLSRQRRARARKCGVTGSLADTTTTWCACSRSLPPRIRARRCSAVRRPGRGVSVVPVHLGARCGVHYRRSVPGAAPAGRPRQDQPAGCRSAGPPVACRPTHRHGCAEPPGRGGVGFDPGALTGAEATAQHHAR
jgi:hypothetical protein